jgi:hypothetical protein
MMSYPTETEKGKFIGVFWAIFNLGGVVGAGVSFAQNYSSTKNYGEITQQLIAATPNLNSILSKFDSQQWNLHSIYRLDIMRCFAPAAHGRPEKHDPF